MDFETEIKSLAKRSLHAENEAITEEATKTSVILPFIQSLGFDVFNLDEVIPEFTADVGTKKGEKVDYAIKIGGQIAMLIEAKPIDSSLCEKQVSQLYRYFSVTDARIGILTNGKSAWFFSDTDTPNKMDKKPFFVYDFQAPDASKIEELSKFQKHLFDVDSIVEVASNLKYALKASQYIKSQLENPDEDFVRFVGREIYDGSVTKAVLEQLRPTIQSALDTIVRDRIQDKLRVSFGSETAAAIKPELDANTSENLIVTTEEEKQAFMIIRAIGVRVTDIERISIRDVQTYCSVLMDDNNRKPICRLHFNNLTTKSIGLFDENKKETKHKVSSLNDIYKFSKEIEDAIKLYG